QQCDQRSEGGREPPAAAGQCSYQRERSTVNRKRARPVALIRSPFTIYRQRFLLPFQPSLDFGPVLVSLGLVGGLEAHHQYRLGIGGSEQAPPLGKGDSNSIDRVDRIQRGVVDGGSLDQVELLLFGAVHPDFRSGIGARQISKQRGETEGLAAHNLQ